MIVSISFFGFRHRIPLKNSYLYKSFFVYSHSQRKKPIVRVELTTNSLQNYCSATELNRQLLKILAIRLELISWIGRDFKSLAYTNFAKPASCLLIHKHFHFFCIISKRKYTCCNYRKINMLPLFFIGDVGFEPTTFSL